jgi:hypothetical protein
MADIPVIFRRGRIIEIGSIFSLIFTFQLMSVRVAISVCHGGLSSSMSWENSPNSQLGNMIHAWRESIPPQKPWSK